MFRDRRSILGAALALPLSASAAGLLTASPAAAAPTDGVTAEAWADIVLEPGVTAESAAAIPQARLVTIAGTTFLQARGTVTCNLTADARVGTLPAGMWPTSLTRATAPRNNSQGINACRFEVSTGGALSLYGGNASNPITWVQFDSVQTIWR